MACLKVLNPITKVLRMLPEGPDGNVRGQMPGEVIVGVDYACSELAIDNLTDVFTPEGLMIGNFVKAVTTKLGLKHCLKCTGRQRRLNNVGITIQRKLGI